MAREVPGTAAVPTVFSVYAYLPNPLWLRLLSGIAAVSPVGRWSSGDYRHWRWCVLLSSSVKGCPSGARRRLLLGLATSHRHRIKLLLVTPHPHHPTRTRSRMTCRLQCATQNSRVRPLPGLFPSLALLDGMCACNSLLGG